MSEEERKFLREAALAAETVADKLTQRFGHLMDADMLFQVINKVVDPTTKLNNYFHDAAKQAAKAWQLFYELDKLSNS